MFVPRSGHSLSNGAQVIAIGCQTRRCSGFQSNKAGTTASALPSTKATGGASANTFSVKLSNRLTTLMAGTEAGLMLKSCDGRARSSSDHQSPTVSKPAMLAFHGTRQACLGHHGLWRYLQKMSQAQLHDQKALGWSWSLSANWQAAVALHVQSQILEHMYQDKHTTHVLNNIMKHIKTATKHAEDTLQCL